MIIRKLRLQKGWSQEQLAEMSGVSTRTIQRIERGKKASLESLKCLAAVFETDFNNLKEDTEMSTMSTMSTETMSVKDREALRQLHVFLTKQEGHFESSGLGHEEQEAM